MTFSILPEEIKIKIFNMLGIGSRYNASLVWEEMTTETWKSIPTEGLISRLTQQNETICNLDDFEAAGVLGLH